jgi:flavodoxin
MAKTLILYYSRRGENYVRGSIKKLSVGNTEVVVQAIAKALGADVFQVETVKPYAENYTQCTEEAKQELREQARPALKQMLTDVAGYDRIIVAGPCWWGTYPMALFTQLDALDLTGKTLFPVMTHEGSGLGHAEKDLHTYYPQAKLGRGLAIRGADVHASRDAIENWLSRNF